MTHLILPAVTLLSLVTGFTGSRVTSAMVSAAEAGQPPVAAVSAKVLLPSARCSGETVSGRRCFRGTTHPSGFCATHRWQIGQVAASWRQ